MENRYASLISEFELRIQKLISEYRILRQENDILKAELSRKQEELMAAHKDILDLRSDYKILQTTMGMGGSEDERKNSRQHLDKIVREIDKCLMLLND